MADFKEEWKELYKKTLRVRTERVLLSRKYGATENLGDGGYGAPEGSGWHDEARRELIESEPQVLELLPYLANI